ncbi:MAG TPA: TolC family protein [Bacteroidia bacterium]|nr:TolC family protein [Bacteroidia bacterium]
MFKHLILLLFFLPTSLFAQINGSISYKQAVELLLKNNFDIQIAKNSATMAEIQNSYGNAGFMPKVDINAGTNLASNKTRQEFANGLQVNQSGVASQNLNAGVFLNWTIFDGMKMFATKERLSLMEQQGQLSLKLQIEQQIEQITILYYQIVRQEQIIKGITISMQVSEERIKLYERKLEIGAGSNVELLQAKLDLNGQKSNLLTQKNLLSEYRSQLLLALKTDANTMFEADSVFEFEYLNSLADIKQKVEQGNQSILFAKRNLQVQTQELKELQALIFPKVGLTSAYNFARAENTAGFALLNQNLGYNFGLNFSWNIFNGFNTRNQIKVGKFEVQNSQIELDKIKFTMNNVTFSAYQTMLNNIEILKLEEENITLAQEALKISLERIKIGLGNYLEIKESQNSYEAAVTRLVNARYNLKISETSIKKLMGTLIEAAK